jgi:hypothetical protein
MLRRKKKRRKNKKEKVGGAAPEVHSPCMKPTNKRKPR